MRGVRGVWSDDAAGAGAGAGVGEGGAGTQSFAGRYLRGGRDGTRAARARGRVLSAGRGPVSLHGHSCCTGAAGAVRDSREDSF